MTPDIHKMPRVAVVVPPSNPVVEPELSALLGPGTALYGSRLPRYVDFDLTQRNRLYVRAYPAALDALAGLDADAALIAMTGPNYRYGIAGDVALCADLTRRFGAPVRTASLAIHDTLVAMGADRIQLLSPYPDWLTAQAVDYWSGAGFAIDAVHQFFTSGTDFNAYDTTADQVTEALGTVASSVPVVLTGTGLATLESLQQAAGDVLLMSSNLCGAWWLARTLQLTGTPLFQGLATRLP